MFILMTVIILLWGSHAAVVVFMSQSLSSLNILFYTFLFATVSLCVFILLSGKLSYVLNNVNLKELPYMTFLGFFGVFGYEFLFIEALSRGSPVEANILNYFWPLMIIVFSVIILKEKFRLNVLMGSILGFIGAATVITAGSRGIEIKQLKLNTVLSYTFAIAAAVIWGCFSVLLKRKKYEPFFAVFYFNLITFLVTGLYLFLNEEIILPTFRDLLILFYFGIGPTFVAFVLWQKVIVKYDIQKVANFFYLTPFVSTLFLCISIGKVLTFYSIIGLVFIVAGTFVGELKQN